MYRIGSRLCNGKWFLGICVQVKLCSIRCPLKLWQDWVIWEVACWIGNEVLTDRIISAVLKRYIMNSWLVLIYISSRNHKSYWANYFLWAISVCNLNSSCVGTTIFAVNRIQILVARTYWNWWIVSDKLSCFIVPIIGNVSPPLQIDCVPLLTCGWYLSAIVRRLITFSAGFLVVVFLATLFTGFYELVCYIEDHRQEYWNFIMTGNEK